MIEGDINLNLRRGQWADFKLNFPEKDIMLRPKI